MSGQPSRESRLPGECVCAFLIHEVRGSVEVGQVARGAATRGGQCTQEEAGLCPRCGLGVGGGWGIVFMALLSPAVTVCGSVGRKDLLPRCAQVNAPESGTGEPSCQGVCESPVQSDDTRPVYGNPIFSPRSLLLPGHGRSAGPHTVRAQFLAPIDSTPVNN